MAARRPFWKWCCWKSISFCVWPPSTCIWNLKLKFGSKLDSCSGNHIIYRQTDGRTDGWTDGRTDGKGESSLHPPPPPPPPSNFVRQGYKDASNCSSTFLLSLLKKLLSETFKALRHTNAEWFHDICKPEVAAFDFRPTHIVQGKDTHTLTS